MRYLYKCNNCKKEQEVEKTMAERKFPELCSFCGSQEPMKRMYTSPSTKTSDGFKR